jgi:hypothetical protein
MKAEDYQEELREVEGVMVRITVYKIGNEFHCHIYNADPGATIARCSASDRETAVRVALEKAMIRITK